MWGNHLADRACIPDYTNFRDLQRLEVLSITTRQALTLFTGEDSFYWADKDGNPTLSTFDDMFDEHLFTDYVTKRDAYRQLRTPKPPPKWSGGMQRSIQFACECAELKTKTEGDKARMIRILWDHFMHGGNYKKWGLMTENATSASKMTQPNTGSRTACTQMQLSPEHGHKR